MVSLCQLTDGGGTSVDKLTIPITKSARQFGYIIWTPKLNDQLHDFLKGASHVNLSFQGADLGEKQVDWKYRRISIGYRWTRRLAEDISQYILTFRDSESKLIVECQ
jgi:hypothetical protein